jgi:hypothetical protein
VGTLSEILLAMLLLGYLGRDWHWLLGFTAVPVFIDLLAFLVDCALIGLVPVLNVCFNVNSLFLKVLFTTLLLVILAKHKKFLKQLLKTTERSCHQDSLCLEARNDGLNC